jgi:hypothetical protein
MERPLSSTLELFASETIDLAFRRYTWADRSTFQMIPSITQRIALRRNAYQSVLQMIFALMEGLRA